MQRDIEYFDQIWQKDKDYKEGYKGVNPASWDKRAEEFNRHVSDERMDKIVELLLEKRCCKKIVSFWISDVDRVNSFGSLRKGRKT